MFKFQPNEGFRLIIFKIVYTLKFQVVSLPWLVTNTAVRYGLLLELDESGNITRSFHDPTGSVIPGYLSEVHDDGDVLFFGSFFSPFVGRLELKE